MEECIFTLRRSTGKIHALEYDSCFRILLISADSGIIDDTVAYYSARVVPWCRVVALVVKWLHDDKSDSLIAKIVI